MTPVFLGALFRAPPPVPRRAPAARTRPRGLRRFARGHRAPATGSGGGDCGGAARAVALIRVANGARPLLPRGRGREEGAAAPACGTAALSLCSVSVPASRLS